jgi:predicted TPR repeat methyltransferase
MKPDYRSFVGPEDKYDLIGAHQFNLLTFYGLREHHTLLDIGCGSLRAGRLFMPYLLPGKYFGTEAEKWIVEDGIKNNIGNDMLQIKKPTFSYDKSFNLSKLNKKFDFILAQSVFSHISSNQIEKCLFEANEVMMPHSIFFASFKEGNENYEGEDPIYPETVAYTLDHIRKLVEDSGMFCVRLDWKHPRGGKPWIAIVKEKNMVNLPKTF